MSPKNGLTKHVALVGMTGAGKSTLVNVLSGSNRARVTNDAKPCTARPDRYDIDEGGVRCTLWDTRGLNEAWEQEATSTLARFLKLIRVLPDADQELRKFLRGKEPKISLILFCIEAEKIRVEAQWKNYDKIYVKFCKRKIKVAVVVTRMDRNTASTNWRKMCESMAMEVVGEIPDARLVEAVPAFERLEETRDCRSRISRLVSKIGYLPNTLVADYCRPDWSDPRALRVVDLSIPSHPSSRELILQLVLQVDFTRLCHVRWEIFPFLTM